MPGASQVQFSKVEFRPHPHETEEKTNLGMIIEFAMPDAWVVGLVMRSELPEGFLDGLDPLSRELMHNRVEVISRELERARKDARSPGDVLKRLSRDNPWSFHVTEPGTYTIPPEFKAEAAQLTYEKMAEKFIISIFHRSLTATTEPAVQQASLLMGRERITAFSGAATLVESVPPPWMLPPRTWIDYSQGSGH